MLWFAKWLIVLFLIFSPMFARAGEVVSGHNGTFQAYFLEFPEISAVALDRINDFRRKAEEYLAREDLPPAVREALPVLALQPPLELDERLSFAAAAHARDMLEGGYFSHVSPGGLGPAERARAAGYLAAFSGESLAVMLFEQPISPEKALRHLLQILEEDALLGRSAEGAPLIFPFYRHVGAAMTAGTMMVEGREYYAYVLAILFGLPEGLVPADETRGFLLGRIPAEGGEPAVLRQVSSGKETPLPTLADGSFFAPMLPPDLYILKAGADSKLLIIAPGVLTVAE